MKLRSIMCGVLLLAGAGLSQTQQAERTPETTFKVGTDLVLLNVSVFDPNWKVIKGLPQSAFTVLV